MTDEIKATRIRKIGEYYIMCADQAGEIKTGEAKEAYRPGDLMLVNATFTVLVGPFNLAGLIEHAETILSGNQRAITHPKTLFMLATGILGFAAGAPPPSSEPKPQTQQIPAAKETGT